MAVRLTANQGPENNFVILGPCLQDKIILSENETVSNGIQDRSTLDKLSLKNPVRRKCTLNGYFLSLFVRELKSSRSYRHVVLECLSKSFNNYSGSYIRIRFNTSFTGRHIIDYKWNNILNYLSYEKRELDSALAWLSTLGGAFSALGDNFENCALMAGRISLQQLKLACKLHDPRIVARCRLYYALSLIQQRQLKVARFLVENVYHDAITYYATDKRLKRMCLGIWTKLQFEWSKKYCKNSRHDPKI